MDCERYREILSGYIDDELSKKDLKELLLHLEHCEACTLELDVLTGQKEKLQSAVSSYCGPAPGHDFCQKVMARISELPSPPVSSRLRGLLGNLLDDFLLPFRKPALAVALVLLLIVGAVGGYFLQSVAILPGQQLTSVYELPTESSSAQVVAVAGAEQEAQIHLFDHFAHTSTETLVTSPCLLEYASYSCAAPVEDGY